MGGLSSLQGRWLEGSRGVSLGRSEEPKAHAAEKILRSTHCPERLRLCHYERKHSQPTPCCSLSRKLAQPPFKAHFWALQVCSPSPGLPVLKCLEPALSSYLGCSGSGGRSGARRLSMGLRGGLREAGQGGSSDGGSTRGGAAEKGVSSCWRRSTQPSSGGAGLIPDATSLGHPPTWPFQGFSGLGAQG